MNTDISEQVVAMANDMVKGVSKLTLMEAKLLRLLIMQIKPNDTDLAPFRIGVSELADLLQIDRSNVYREADRMTTHLMREIVQIGDGNPKHAYKKFQWVSYCEYDGAGTIWIRLHPQLQPYLIGLQKWYTQYRIEDIIGFRSVYSIRLYELIALSLRGQKPHGNVVTEIYLSMDDIRAATGTADKYERVSSFRAKVIETALQDINERSGYHVEYRVCKAGKRVDGFYFSIQSQARYQYIERRKSVDAPPVEEELAQKIHYPLLG